MFLCLQVHVTRRTPLKKLPLSFYCVPVWYNFLVLTFFQELSPSLAAGVLSAHAHLSAFKTILWHHLLQSVLHNHLAHNHLAFNLACFLQLACAEAWCECPSSKCPLRSVFGSLARCATHKDKSSTLSFMFGLQCVSPAFVGCAIV
jgi:hypothetical protein